MENVYGFNCEGSVEQQMENVKSGEKTRGKREAKGFFTRPFGAWNHLHAFRVEARLPIRCTGYLFHFPAFTHDLHVRRHARFQFARLVVQAYLDPKTSFTLSSFVWTFFGVNSASEEM